MIRVQRHPHQAAETALTKRSRNGLTEVEHALWHFADQAPALTPLPPKPTKAPGFAAYKRQPVKDALAGLFGPKCAYCEFRYAGGAPMDVEHYRPKGGYLDERGVLRKPGYYWLAADWDNLLPSCIDCNRERKQVYRARDGKLVKGKSGKANHFPILAGTARATAPAGIATEQPLLLDPCRDRPELHLHFLADGFVEPALTPEETARPRGKATIQVYGLAREGLVGDRRERALLIKAAMQAVLAADTNMRLYAGHPAAVTALVAAEAGLAAFGTPDTPFLAMKQAMDAAFIEVRTAAADYHACIAAWKNMQGASTRQALTGSLARIGRLRGNTSFDRRFVADLLALAGVPAHGPGDLQQAP
jgi:uncharacterized protein (TIGR02646 family)